MHLPSLSDEPSPAPWLFAERLYRIAHCLVDRYGPVARANLQGMVR